MAEFYDIDDTFSLNAKGDINMKADGDAIRQSIRHIILSQTGVKPGFGQVNVNFGVGTNSFLFAPLTAFTAKVFADTIYAQLVTFEPRINVELVNVQSKIADRAFEVEIRYSVDKASEIQVFRTIINQI
jgi:phage baseplate assembly protein W